MTHISPPVVEYGWMDTSKEVIASCDGWGNQQPWTLSWLLEQIHNNPNKHVLSLLHVHAHSSYTVTNKELDILCITPSNEAIKMLNKLSQKLTYRIEQKDSNSRELSVCTIVY